MPESTTRSKVHVGGPRIVYLCTAVVIGLFFFVFQAGGWPESAHQFLRVSGRLGLALFVTSFGASSLNRLFHAGWTRYLLANRRYLGISTAVTMWAHFATILTLMAFESGWKEVNAPLMVLLPGTTVFVLIGLMALTSNDTAQQRLGRQRWKLLHLAGGYAALGAFIFEYVLQLFLTPDGMVPTLAPIYACLLLGTTVVFLLLRLTRLRLAKPS